MKILITIIVLIFVGVGLWMFIPTKNDNSNAPENEAETTTASEPGTPPEEGSYTINAEQSTVKWIAEKPQIIGYTHHGSFTVQEGTLTFENDSLRGEVVLDMTKLQVESLGGGKAGNESRLETHLKSGDFFEVETYPTAQLTIKSASQAEGENQYTIVGDLTIKDKTEEITFPATLTSDDEALRMDAEFEINRTRWDITFGSASFFDNLADNAISDIVKISVNLLAQ